MNRHATIVTLLTGLMLIPAAAADPAAGAFYVTTTLLPGITLEDVERAEAPIDIAVVARSPIGAIELACYAPDGLVCVAWSSSHGELRVLGTELVAVRHHTALVVEVETDGCGYDPPEILCQHGFISIEPNPSP